jgi:hypothetical protein
MNTPDENTDRPTSPGISKAWRNKVSREHADQGRYTTEQHVWLNMISETLHQPRTRKNEELWLKERYYDEEQKKVVQMPISMMLPKRNLSTPAAPRSHPQPRIHHRKVRRGS